MPFRFYRRRRIAPGIRLNLSKSGPSLTFGGHGVHYTVAPHRHRTTVGIPGTGLYYTSYSRTHARAARRSLTTGTSARQQTAGTRGVAPAVPTPPHPPAPVHPVGPSALSRLLDLVTPAGRARRLLDTSHHATEPTAARRLIDRAARLAPGLPEVLGSEAAWTAAQSQWPAAANLYARYLTAVPADHEARAQYARCLVLAGFPYAALVQFVLLRQFPLDSAGLASITAFMAIAFLMKGDPAQARALVNEAPLATRPLGAELQHCLYLRGVAEYMLGRGDDAVADLDELWALNPLFPDLVAHKGEMQAGTFLLQSPAGPIGPRGLVAGPATLSAPTSP